MLIIVWSLLYLLAIFLKNAAPLKHDKDLYYYDGSRGRMDRNCYPHDELLQKSRPKRTPQSPTLWAKSSESQGVSCPTRLRENSLDSLGDGDRVKDVVHIPCPKRKESGVKVVTSFKGKTRRQDRDKVYRGPRQLFKKNTNPRANDLNHSVKQNAQWLILSSHDRILKPNAGQNLTNLTSLEQAGLYVNNVNSPMLNSPGQVSDKTAYWQNQVPSIEEPRKTSWNKPSNSAPGQYTDSHLKQKYQVPQIMTNNPQIQKLERMGQRVLEPSNPGSRFESTYRNLSNLPPRHDGPMMGPDVKAPVQNPYDPNRPLINGYNMSYDGPHHSVQPSVPNQPGPQSNQMIPHPGANFSFLVPIGARIGPPYDNTPQVTQRAQEPEQYNASLPAIPPKNGQDNESKAGQWFPGAARVDIPPGPSNQPKIPKFSTPPNNINLKDIPRPDLRVSSHGQPSQDFPRYDVQSGQYHYQPAHIMRPSQDSWMSNGNLPDPQQNHHPQQPNMVGQEPAVPQHFYDKPPVTPILEKITQSYKGVFGKSKKEEPKTKWGKPSKNAAVPPFIRTGGIPDSGNEGNANRPANPSQISQQEFQQSSRNHEMETPQLPGEGKKTNFRVAMTGRRISQDWSASNTALLGHSNYSDLSHILNPPVTVNPSLFTNQAHKIVSKTGYYGEVTYTPFRGVPPARNDEPFYDKSMSFLGRIDHPPLVNVKKHKWIKLGKNFNIDGVYNRLRADYPVGMYSEPADFHSDAFADDFSSDANPSGKERHSRKCHRNRAAQWRPLKTQTRTKT